MPELSIVLPCLNEAETLETVINKAKDWCISSDVSCEIIVADNGSIDGSIEIAKANGARVIHVAEKGYGAALYSGFEAAESEYIIMGDSDDSYDFSSLDVFWRELLNGADFVIGNRFGGGIEKGAMPWKNRYIGNPILSAMGRLLFNTHIRDFHCGIRGITKSAFKRMDLRSTGMEFASEMIVKATSLNLNIVEVPTTLSKDGRSRPPHLRPFRDGWRHVRFMLLASPTWLFQIPSLLIFFTSVIAYLTLLSGQLNVFGINFDIHTLFYAQIGIFLGVLIHLTGRVAQTIGTRDGFFLGEKKKQHKAIGISPEFGALIGALLVLVGLLWGGLAINEWGEVGFGDLENGQFLRIVSLSSSLISVGGTIFSFSLLQGFLMLPTRKVFKESTNSCTDLTVA
jgi:glycosyltransferase involved in cell wall biosynthesis